MRIECFPSDRTGCGNYRIAWPAAALAAQGHDVHVRYSRPQVIMDRGRVVASAEVLKADVMVFQRPARLQYIDFFKVLQAQGIRVVVDMDDDLSTIHPLNFARNTYESRNVHWKFAIQACKGADWVTASTPYLAERYGNEGRTTVLSNCVPEAFLDVEVPRDGVTVGWAGKIATHPRDLHITHGAINAALAKTEAKFYAMGDQKTLNALGIRERPPHLWCPGVPITEYPAEVAKFDIGIAPLEESVFNTAKSWLKGLEYAALGVAPVVSPTPDNMRLVEGGAALSASNPREWHEHVRRLIESESERKELAGSARKFARNWTIEGNAWRWLAAWSNSKQ